MKAFPNLDWIECDGKPSDRGMDLRDYFAAKAMQAIVSQTATLKKYTVEMTVEDAYKLADAMMEARND